MVDKVLVIERPLVACLEDNEGTPQGLGLADETGTVVVSGDFLLGLVGAGIYEGDPVVFECCITAPCVEYEEPEEDEEETEEESSE